MAFWGLEILPGKPMPLNLTRRLVVKQAALVVAKPAKKTEPCVLSVCAATTAAPEKAFSRTKSRAIRAYLQRQWARVASPHELSLPLSPSLPMPLLPPTPPPPGSPDGGLLLVPIAPPPPPRRCRSRRTSSATLSAGCTRACSSSARWSFPSRQATRRRFRAPSGDTSETLPRHFRGAGSERRRCRPRYCPRYALPPSSMPPPPPSPPPPSSATAALRHCPPHRRRPRRRHLRAWPAQLHPSGTGQLLIANLSIHRSTSAAATRCGLSWLPPLAMNDQVSTVSYV